MKVLIACTNSGRVTGYAEVIPVNLTAPLLPASFLPTIQLQSEEYGRNASMKRPVKIVVVDRFAPLRTQLLTLLASLCEDDWASSYRCATLVC